MKKVIKFNLLLALGAGIYLIWLNKTGMGIPCLFRTLWGFYCPGCGMTHAIVALSQADLALAFSYHWAFVLSIPALLYLYVIANVRYIRQGTIYFNHYENIIMGMIIALFILRAITLNF
ncbi:MAG: DUF2752 domain-containing protein [Erysipelotrichaceae bacterium]|nr:DUF2752 domain-containing protein [Erysipelotrichaceae bacterium]MDY5252987.1 DUF2752 domain-containing protein [Erysipelotrichaceae bacterium]